MTQRIPKPGTVCHYRHEYGEGICIVLGRTGDFGHSSGKDNVAINWVVPIPKLNYRRWHPRFDYDAGAPAVFWGNATEIMKVEVGDEQI